MTQSRSLPGEVIDTRSRCLKWENESSNFEEEHGGRYVQEESDADTHKTHVPSRIWTITDLCI